MFVRTNGYLVLLESAPLDLIQGFLWVVNLACDFFFFFLLRISFRDLVSLIGSKVRQQPDSGFITLLHGNVTWFLFRGIFLKTV